MALENEFPLCIQSGRFGDVTKPHFAPLCTTTEGAPTFRRPRRVFFHCTTQQWLVANPKKDTSRCALSESLHRCLARLPRAQPESSLDNSLSLSRLWESYSNGIPCRERS